MFIQRKPKPNGILIWTAATFVSHPSSNQRKLPFFIDTVLHLKPNDGGPEEAVRIMMKKWRFSNKPHIIADSGFGSFSLLQDISNWGGVATLSLPINETRSLGECSNCYIYLNNRPITQQKFALK